VTGGITIITILAIGNHSAIGIAITLFVVIPPIILLIFKVLEFDTRSAAKRLQELERSINDIAGEHLLVWETNNGIYKVGYGARFKASRSAGYFFLVLLLIAVVFSVYEASLYKHLLWAYNLFASWLP
jgi:hypothetical protein